MAKIKLTEKLEYDLQLLLSFSKESLEFLIDNLEKVGNRPSLFNNLPENLHEVLNISEENLRNIVSLIIGLHQSKQGTGYSSERIADDLVETITETGNEKLKSEHCKEYLLKVMSISSISATVNILTALSNREKILFETEIITDVRPIFEQNKLTDLLIIHNLRIQYGELDKRSEIYLALDRNDLGNLRDSIKNAELKEEAIKSKLSSADVAFIDLESD